MSKIEEMASIAEYNGTSRKEFEDGFIAGANTVLEEIEITLNADRILSHPFPTKEMRLWSIQDKIKELKGE